MSIKVIGAGFPRTGTTTLKRSLESLGYNKTYHMKELLVNPEKLHHWEELEKTRTTDWDKLYEEYEASVDYPGYPYYKEQMEKYPDAKVILTVRPFDKWYKSVESTVWKAGPQTLPEKLGMMWKMLTNPRIKKVVMVIKMFKRIFFGNQLQGRFEDKEFAEKVWNDHIEEVKAHVPAEKLLIYDVRDGWEPLCKFLDKPVPPEPLPHLNKRENFKEMLPKLMKGEMV